MNSDTKHQTKLPKNRTKKYWSKRKRYGWGWIPVTWQGWTVLTVWLAFIVFVSIMLFSDSEVFIKTEQIWIFLSLTILATVPMILIFYMTGPKPKRRWGKKDNDNPDEDW